MCCVEGKREKERKQKRKLVREDVPDDEVEEKEKEQRMADDDRLLLAWSVGLWFLGLAGGSVFCQQQQEAGKKKIKVQSRAECSGEDRKQSYFCCFVYGEQSLAKKRKKKGHSFPTSTSRTGSLHSLHFIRAFLHPPSVPHSLSPSQIHPTLVTYTHTPHHG